MKKKLFIILSALICVLCCAFAFTACVDKGTPEVTVTLKANGGAFTDGRTSYVITADSGSSLQGLVPYPSKEGYIFEAWATDEAGANIIDLEGKPVTSNIVAYAVWAEKVSMTYNANGGQFDNGESVFATEIKKGGSATAPTDISRENYEFGGWYKGSVEGGKVILSESFDFSAPISEDTEVYAKWVLGAGARLSAPDNIVVTYDCVTWDKVDGANGYGVIVCDSEDEEVYSNYVYSEIAHPGFGRLGEGTYKVYVRSNGDGINYTNSGFNWVSYRYMLDTVAISFDITTSELTWSEKTSGVYPETESYSLYIYDAEDYTLDSEPLYKSEDITAVSYDMASYDAGAYRIVVTSKARGFTSVYSAATVTKVRLATPEVEIVNANDDFSQITLQWNEVKYANRYIVTIGSGSIITSDLTYTITDGELNGNYNNFDFTCEEGMVAVRAFDYGCDYLVSIPTYLAASKDVLTEITTSSSQGSVTVSGKLYEYNKAPFSVRVDYLSNLYVYDTAMALRNYFDLYYSTNGRIISSSNNSVPPSSMFRTYPVTDSVGLELPEHFRLCFVPKVNYNINYTYIQCGWYADLECTVPFDFSAPVTRNITIYAGWVEINEKLKVNDIFNNDFSLSGNYSTTGSYSADAEGDVNVYFAARFSMKYTVEYNNDISGSWYSNCITVYNMTKGENIATINVTSDSVRSYKFQAEAGDLIRLTFSHTGEEASTLSWKFYRGTLSTMPSGGKAGENNYSSADVSSNSKVYALKGTLVTLSVDEADGYNFLGWYDSDGNLVSQEYTYSFVAGEDTQYNAEWEER